MSKAVMGAVEIAGGAVLAAMGNPIGIGLLMAGIATEASAIAQALGSNNGMGITTRSAAALRQIIRGEQRIGGTIVYCSTTGSTKRQYNMVIVLATHPCELIENLYLDGRQVYWNGSGNGYNVRDGIGFGGVADPNTHTGPNGQHYSFGSEVYCYPHYGTETAATVDNADLYANDSTWAPNTNGTPYLGGCTWVYLKLEADSSTFPTFPEIRFTVRGKNDIWDPRTSTRGYTTNWALHIADAITDPLWGLGDNTVNQNQLIAAANVCDEQVLCQAPTTTLDGQVQYGTQNEARYSLHWKYDTGIGPGDAIASMMDAAAGRLSRIGGEWYIWPAYWQGPSFSFNQDVLLDAFEWDPNAGLAALCNRVTGTFIAPNYPYNVTGNLYDSNGYYQGQTQNNFPFEFQPTDYPMYAADERHGYGSVTTTGTLVAGQNTITAIASLAGIAVGMPLSGTGIRAGSVIQSINAGANSLVMTLPATASGTGVALKGSIDVYLQEDGGIYLPKNIDQRCVLSMAQAQRVAKIFLLRSRQKGAGRMTMGLAAFQMQPTDVMQFTFGLFGWNNKNLEICYDDAELEFHVGPIGNEKDPTIYLVIPVRETDSSVYEWELQEELNIYDIPVFPGFGNPYQVPVPTGVTAISDLATALVQPNGRLIPRIEVTWIEPADTRVTNGGSIEVQICAHASAAWQGAIKVDGQTTAVWLGNVITGLAYDVRVRAVRVNGAYSDWVELDNIVCGFAQDAFGLTPVAPPGTVQAFTISSTDSAIVVDPFTATAPGGYSAACLPGGAVTLDGYTPQKFYYVYYIDPTFAGGAITPIVTTNEADFVNKPGYFYIGGVLTPAYGSSGSTGVFRPSSFDDQGNRTTSTPANAYDGDLATYAELTAQHTSLYGQTNADCTFAGFPSYVTTAAKTLKVTVSLAAPSSSNPSTVTAQVGGTFTTMFNSSTSSAQADCTMTIPSGTNLASISIEAIAGSQVGVDTATVRLRIYEISIQ